MAVRGNVTFVALNLPPSRLKNVLSPLYRSCARPLTRRGEPRRNRSDTVRIRYRGVRRDQISGGGSLLAANYGRIRRNTVALYRWSSISETVNERVFRSKKSGKMDPDVIYIQPLFARRFVARHACLLVYISLSLSLLFEVIKNPRVTFYRCSTVVSLLVSCGSVSWISCLVAFRNSATGTPRVWGLGNWVGWCFEVYFGKYAIKRRR